MTCIVGLVEEGVVYMGADSESASGWNMRIIRQTKVFKTGPFLIGYTSSFRMGQLLQYQLEVKPQGEEGDFAYMVTAFSEAVRNVLKEHGYARIDSNQEEGGFFMIGYRGCLYTMQNDFSVLQYEDGFDAIGCGEPYALAAMAALVDMPPLSRIERALEITASFSNGVSAPFVMLQSGGL